MRPQLKVLKTAAYILFSSFELQNLLIYENVLKMVSFTLAKNTHEVAHVFWGGKQKACWFERNESNKLSTCNITLPQGKRF